MAARKYQYAAEPQPFWGAESYFAWRAGRVSGPYGGILRWGEQKHMEKLLRMTWAAVRGGPYGV